MSSALLKKALPIGAHHFQVFDPVTATPLPDSALTFFCTNVDRAYFKRHPTDARLRINGEDVGSIDEVFEPFPADHMSGKEVE